jgi:hypothetical protein
MSTRLHKPNSDKNVINNNVMNYLNGDHEYFSIVANGNNPPTVKANTRFMVYKTTTYTISNDYATGNNEYIQGATPTILLNEVIFEPSDETFTWNNGTDFPVQSDGTWYLYCRGCLDTDETTIGKGSYWISKTDAPAIDYKKGGYYNTADGLSRCLASFVSTSGVVSALNLLKCILPYDQGQSGQSLVSNGDGTLSFSYAASTLAGYIDGLLIENDSTSLTIKKGLNIQVAGTMYVINSDEVITPTAISGGGYKWRCLVAIEGTGVRTWKNLSDFDNAGYTLSESTNQLDLNTLYDADYGYCRGTIGANAYRIFYIFKQFSTFTNSTVNTQTTKILTCNSLLTPKLSIGQKISGTDIPAYSEIVEIIDSTSFRINQDCTGSTSNITMTVADGIIYGFNIEGIPKSFIMACTHIAVATYAATPYDIEIHTIEIDVNSEFSNTGSPKVNLFIPEKKSKYDIRLLSNIAPLTGAYAGSIILYRDSGPYDHQDSVTNQLFDLITILDINKGENIKFQCYAASGNATTLNLFSTIRGTKLIIREV